ncbi:MAG: retaining beta-L-arabinofuranosidase [Armatimonadetes bacterium]|jgi:DUF1680 family protein|nr:retaining beta-L-arabinofuranosidase [Armatimonadota bacterium]
MALVSGGLLLARSGGAAGPAVTDRAPATVPDVLILPSPETVHLEGYLGDRVARSEKNRLLEVDIDRLLAGFRKRPGEQAWIGEHIGKWLHAATLAWVNTGDAKLRAKLDSAAAELIKTQEADGYLGTYVPGQRFGLYRNADWDVWVHKYNLIGLLTYHRYTGNGPALDASRKMGDLLVRTFGPGKKSILSAGTHGGMAATSVLEPMVLLYRATGDRKYLGFGKYLVEAWEEPNGPRILQTLLTEKSVARTGNAKAYEMLSNLVGLCELYRSTGDRRYLQASINAWEDVTAHQLYITGSASRGEHFGEPYDLPNQQGAHVGETCVTVTWIQLSSQLLRLTGEARYGDELERSYYNHLTGAQRPDGAEWCYYTSLEGIKPYGPGINCCVSSGPRGMALAPQLAFLKYRDGGNDGIAVNLYDAGRITTDIAGEPLTLELKSNFPQLRAPKDRSEGRVTLITHAKKPVTAGLKLRVPAWAEGYRVKGGRLDMKAARAGWLAIAPRQWKDGEHLDVTFRIPVRLIRGEHTNDKKAALAWGPLVLAYDEKLNAGLPRARGVGMDGASDALTLQPGSPLAFRTKLRTSADGPAQPAVLVPFSEAGASGGRYQVWLWAPGTPLPAAALLAAGQESRSRDGNANGSITDGEIDTFVVTFDGNRSDEDWYAIELDVPRDVRRVVYAHGKNFHDGGWFDASAGKPRVEVRREKNGPWLPAGTLDDYPATTATNARGLKPGQLFTLRLAAPQKVWAVRVIGKPAHGDNPQQAFSSCAELQALPE